MKYLLTMMLISLPVYACDQCFKCFDWLANSDRYCVQETDDLYWKGYMDAHKHAFVFCRDIIGIYHPECHDSK